MTLDDASHPGDRAGLLQQAATVLEWPRVLDVLAGLARSPMGAERSRTLPLERDLEGARARMQETAEMTAMREGPDPFPSLAFPDLREVLGRVAKGAVLEPHELRALSIVLGLVDQVERYAARYRALAPALAAAAAPLAHVPEPRRTKSTIDRCVDPEGHIRESATPELSRLTHHANGLKQTMRHRLEVILASSRYAEVLQEHYFAQREGRYVVPIKAEMRGRIPGIVHDVSASGATVFLEPRELVELNNAIKVAELEVEREVKRILQELSAEVAAQAPACLQALDTLAELDCIAAKAAFSRLIGGAPVSVNGDGRVTLRQARHPLLVLGGDPVVPNDIMLDESVCVMVISGPNTGGKTVTLKIVGLFALMVRAGLQPPCRADSEMAFFPEVYADIGDAQDLTKHLSSFSAHITQMIQLLSLATRTGVTTSGEPAGVSQLGALVLLDEPVTSTDPAEGAALAEALLLRLAELGLKVVATTHYNSLKALAEATPGFVNASVEFDVSRLAPTYRLIMHLPGGSSAIDIAGRLGMDEAILEQALRLVRREDRNLERMLSELQEKQRRLDADLTRSAELRAEAERSAREAAEIAERLRTTEREERKSLKKKLTDEVLKARAAVQAVLEGVKRERTLIRAKEAKERLAEIESEARARLVPPVERRPVEELQVGDRVEIVRLGTTGTLVDAPQGKRRVRVRVGEREMSVAVSELAGLVGVGEEPGVAAARRAAPVLAGTRPEHAEAVMVLDVRGKMAEEALDMTIAALDRAALAGTPVVRIIHGHGTGRLKAVLRDYLKGSPYVTGFRAGERSEGGDGVTIVELK
jgi:DNA mismatch repair protein MutS2